MNYLGKQTIKQKSYRKQRILINVDINSSTLKQNIQYSSFVIPEHEDEYELSCCEACELFTLELLTK